MDVFQEEITFQKMGQASQADIFFDAGGDKSGIFVGNRAVQTKKGCRTLCPAAPIGNGKISLRAPCRNYMAA